uniref:Transposable element P transposase-like RNase H C-terminal domain-containing protein n=1 Tax=Ciona intestinalis TaxID=7719 RepID=F6QB69_CIOIN
MKVNLAKDVLSWRVGQCLSRIPGANGTSDFVLMFSKWFEIINCSTSSPIRDCSDTRLKWLEEMFINKLLEWKSYVELNHPGEHKRLLARPTLEGLLFTTCNFIGLSKRLLQHLDYVCLHSFNQDILEAFFGNLRQLGRRSENPDASQAAYGIQHLTVRKVIKKIKGSNASTTYGKNNAWTNVCDVPMPK